MFFSAYKELHEYEVVCVHQLLKQVQHTVVLLSNRTGKLNAEVQKL